MIFGRDKKAMVLVIYGVGRRSPVFKRSPQNDKQITTNYGCSAPTYNNTNLRRHFEIELVYSCFRAFDIDLVNTLVAPKLYPSLQHNTKI